MGSLRSPSEDGLRRLAKIAHLQQTTGKRVVFVLSAFSGTTDRLKYIAEQAALGKNPQSQINYLRQQHSAFAEFSPEWSAEVTSAIDTLLEELINVLQSIKSAGELSPQNRDYVLSFGERLSTIIAYHYLRAFNREEVALLDSRKMIITDESYNCAVVDFQQSNAKIRDAFSRVSETVSLVPGYIAATRDGITTTLGRGGSDYTASIFGAALGADEIIIRTDVDGIKTADPRVIPEAVTIPSISYELAMELASCGAKVLYPPTVEPARLSGIPIRIIDNSDSNAQGTLISSRDHHNDAVVGVASRILMNNKNLAHISLVSCRASPLREEFVDLLNNRQIAIRKSLISNTGLSVSAEIHTDELQKALHIIHNHFLSTLFT